MDKYRILTAVLLTALMILPVALTPSIAFAQEVGPATNKITWSRFTLDEIAEAFRTDKVDVYLFGLDPDVAQEMAQIPGIKLYTAPAGLNDFGLNPAPVQIVEVNQVFTSKEDAAAFFGVDPVVIRYVEPMEEEGKTTVEFCAMQADLPAGTTIVWESDKLNLNPFCFRDIRFAMNYVIDRERIVKEVYKGFAIPKYTFYGPDDPVYTELIDVVAEFRFTYQPQLAKSIVNDVMTRAGAQLQGGTWYYMGKPVSITAIIRVEDQRFELGHIFAQELKNLGFLVNIQELTFFEAILKVYFTDPKDFEWGFYTEGWGKGAIDKWDAGNLAQFGATWLGWAPGWGEADYWNYKPEVVDEEGNNVDFYSKATQLMQNITSKEQWIDYLRKGTRLGTLEAIRIWVVATLDSFPAKEDLRGVTVDMGAGLRSLFNCRGWSIPGTDTVRVGHLWTWTTRSVWNVFGGFNDVYSVDPARCTFDPFAWFHPFNGRPIEFRATFDSIETAGPEGKLPVPSDAIWWDAENDAWVPASQLGRTEATSKVVLDLSKFFGSKWHHGVEITWADLLMYWGEWIDITYDPEKSVIESSIAEPTRPILDTFVAIRPLVDENKLEVYINYWHFDEAYIGLNAILATVDIPAELVALHDYVAFVTKERALSDTRSKDEGIPQLSLVLPDDAQLAKEKFQGDLGANGYNLYRPFFTLPDGTVLMTQDEWNARARAVVSWVDQYGLAWISQGPFMLTFFDKDAQKLELTAFRDPTYPFGPADWVFGEPQPTTITQVSVPLVEPGRPAQIIVSATGIAPLHVKWLLRDPLTGQIVAKGEAEPTATGFLIFLDSALTEKLAEYAVYELAVIAYSEVIALPAESVQPLRTTAAITKEFEQLRGALEEVSKATAEQLTQVQQQFQQQVSQLQQQFQQQIQELQSALGGQLANALQGLSNTLATTTQDLSNTLATTIQQLSTTLDTSLKDLGDRLDKSIGDLSSKVDTLSSTVDQLQSQVSTLSDTADAARSVAEEAKNAADSAASSARIAMILGVLNLIILLAIAALIFRSS
ncbi:MAG: ABC transporter substrate-binding protein [Desulfurococcales archaeon]|nr:ABC transporter substrate-binding protein [Desulfurococcales archaeon]